MTEDAAPQIQGIAALADPVRRSLYDYVVAATEAVSRDQAAAGADVPRHTAKFHLDRLVREGLLVAEFRRISGRQGPGAGRPAKLYRRAAQDVAVSLPPRRYQLAGRVLAAAVEKAARDGVPVLDAVRSAAGDAGRAMAADAQDPAGAGGEPDVPQDAVAAALRRHGYEPRESGGRIELANCPFHALAQDHTALVCDMNLAAVTALADEMRLDPRLVRLDPGPGRCCVVLDVAVTGGLTREPTPG